MISFRRIVLLAACLLLAVSMTALAQENEGGSDIQIDFPPSVWAVTDTVDVVGTVNPPDLQSYFLEAAPFDADVPDEQARWTPVSLPSRTPIEDGVIARWDTTLVPDGIYRLRLRVVLTTGATSYAVVAPIRVANDFEVPSAGEDVASAPTPVPLEAVTQAAPTEPPTPTVIPTPTLVPRPVVNNDLPIPMGGHISGFNEATLDLIRPAGLTWLKWQIPFVVGDDSLIAVARDRINWSHQNGFLVMLSIKGNKDELGAMGEDYFPLYADFVGLVAALQPDAIQVWNEMNLDREWPQGQIDPRMYVEMLRQAYEAIKAVDPSIKVITGAPAPTGAEGAFGLSRVWNDDRYYLGMANAGAANYADCIGIHYNEGIIAPQQQGGDPRGGYPTYYFPLMIQRAAFPFRDTGIPFCFSELGYLSPEGYGTLPDGFAWAANTSVEEQATWLRDAVMIAAETSSVKIDLIILWNLDFSNFEEDPQAGYAIVRADGTCPACDALATLRGQ